MEKGAISDTWSGSTELDTPARTPGGGELARVGLSNEILVPTYGYQNDVSVCVLNLQWTILVFRVFACVCSMQSNIEIMPFVVSHGVYRKTQFLAFLSEPVLLKEMFGFHKELPFKVYLPSCLSFRFRFVFVKIFRGRFVGHFVRGPERIPK